MFQFKIQNFWSQRANSCLKGEGWWNTLKSTHMSLAQLRSSCLMLQILFGQILFPIHLTININLNCSQNLSIIPKWTIIDSVLWYYQSSLLFLVENEETYQIMPPPLQKVEEIFRLLASYKCTEKNSLTLSWQRLFKRQVYRSTNITSNLLAFILALNQEPPPPSPLTEEWNLLLISGLLKISQFLRNLLTHACKVWV